MQFVIGKNGSEADDGPIIFRPKSAGDMNRFGSTAIPAQLPALKQTVVTFKIFHDV
jgi:hypothetical protein